MFSKNLFVGKFSVRKFASENLMSENLFRKIQRRKNLLDPSLTKQMEHMLRQVRQDRGERQCNVTQELRHDVLKQGNMAHHSINTKFTLFDK